MSIRTAQKLVTRQRILDAVLDLVAEGGLTEVSVPDVARRSGASVATIYRYFPTKDALFQAAAEEPAMRGGRRAPAEQIGSGGEYLQQLWAAFAENMALLRHQLASDAGPRDAGGPVRGVAAVVCRRGRRAVASIRHRRRASDWCGSRCC